MLNPERIPILKPPILPRTPEANGPICRCPNPRCQAVFRAESRKRAICPVCGKSFIGGM